MGGKETNDGWERSGKEKNDGVGKKAILDPVEWHRSIYSTASFDP